MNNFKKGGFRQGGGSQGGRPKFGGKFGGGRDGGNRSGARPGLFPAICSDCRKNCEVPFRPTGDKPVYCRECFGKPRGAHGPSSGGSERPRGDFRRDERPQFEHKSESVAPQNNIGVDELKKQLSALEVKINSIFEIVSRKPEVIVEEKLPVKKTAKKIKK